jgi:cytochrome c2
MRASDVYQAVELAIAKPGAYRTLKCRNCVVVGERNDTTGPELQCRLGRWSGGTPLEFINARDARIARKAAGACRDCGDFEE